MSDQTNEEGEAEDVVETAAPTEDQAPRNGVINVLGQDWAIGLAWYFFDTSLLQQALSRLLVDYDSIYLPRNKRHGNIAVAHRDMGHVPGIVSAGASLADWRGVTSWLGCYPLGAGLYWIVGVVEGVAVEDTAAIPEAEARALYKEMTSPAWSWETIYVPEGWESGGIRIQEDYVLRPSLESDLGAAEPGDKIVGARVLQRALRKVAPYVIVVVGVLAIAYLLDVPGRIASLFEEETITREPSIEDLPPIWENEAVGVDWALACARSLRPESYFVPAWDLQRITCDAESDSVIYEYTRGDDGLVRQLEVIWDNITDDKQLQTSNTVSFVVTPLGYAGIGRFGVPPVYSVGEIGSVYFDLSLITPDVPSLGAAIENDQERQLFAEENVIRILPAYSFVPVSMSSTRTPKRWLEIYGLEGLVLDRVTYDGSTWTYEGKIYAKQ